jgi:hypothetical protein
MRKYRSNADSITRVDFGVDVIEALRGFTETTAVGDALEKVNENLDASFEARRKQRKPWMRSRAKLRIVEYKLELTIRSSHKAAQLADGGRSGAITDIGFPEGVTPVTVPTGDKQTKTVEDLMSRIQSVKGEGADAYRKEWHPKLKAALAAFTEAQSAYEAARKAYYTAFTEELTLRDDHERQIERAMGQVRAAFPKDTARQNLIFPKAARSTDEDAEEVTDEITNPPSE